MSPAAFLQRMAEHPSLSLAFLALICVGLVVPHVPEIVARWRAHRRHMRLLRQLHRHQFEVELAALDGAYHAQAGR